MARATRGEKAPGNRRSRPDFKAARKALRFSTALVRFNSTLEDGAWIPDGASVESGDCRERAHLGHCPRRTVLWTVVAPLWNAGALRTVQPCRALESAVAA